MLSIMDPRPARTCAGLCRREFLRVGGLALGGLSLPQLLAARANAETSTLRHKSVVLLFLQGGPPHIEFFDPKMSAPSEIRSITGEVQTNLPGITFGSTFSKLAAMTDKISIVRSYGSGQAAHTYGQVVSGGNPTEAAMSALYARIRGNNHPQTGMPTNVLVMPEAIKDGLKLGGNFETGALPTLTQPGKLGPTFAAFNPAGGGQLKENMTLRISAERLQDRRSLLSELDRIRRDADHAGRLASVDTFRQQAYDVITRGVASAFDLSQEDPATLARYDTTKLFDDRKLQKYYDMRRVTNLLGHQLLLARRLCEAGAGFVTVSDCGWDYHANNNSPKGMTGIWPMGNQVDHAVSAFLEDLHARGLQNDILLVVTGEMGRSPKINGGGGRDHYGEMTSLLVAGGGLKMGQVIGQTDANASRATTKPYRPEHLLATVMHTLFDVAELRLLPGLPRDILKVVEDGEPIEELMA